MFPGNGEELQRVAEVKSCQGFTRRALARRLGVEPHVVEEWEKPGTDLKLSELYALARAMEVPPHELLLQLDDRGAAVDRAIAPLVELVRVTKHLAAIRENSSDERARRHADNALAILTSFWPDLAEISPMHEVGKRRTLDEPAGVELRMIPTAALDPAAV